MTPRFWQENYIRTATVTASSEDVGLPIEHLSDPSRTTTYRTAVGWVITDHNNRLDFDIGAGEVTATVANGHYQTGNALGAAVVAALEAASAPPVWLCDFDASTHKFTLGQGSVHSILWATGSNSYRSIGRSLGFDVSSNRTGATTYIADEESHQSTHTLVVELTAAQMGAGCTSVGIIGHNIQAGSAVLACNTLNTWATPTLLATVTDPGGADVRAYFSDPGRTFFRLVIDDVSNPTGYARIGVLYLSDFVSAPYHFSVEQTRGAIDNTKMHTAIEGHHFVNLGVRARTFSLGIPDASDSELEDLREFFSEQPIGKNFILDSNPDVAATEPAESFYYGFLPDTESETHLPIGQWDTRFNFVEAV